MGLQGTEKSAGPTDGALEALAHAAGRLGLPLSAEKLARGRPIGSGTPGDAEFLRLAAQSGLKIRQVRLDWRHLSELGRAFPAILRLDDGRFVVAEGFVGGAVPAVLLRDPTEPDAPAVPIDEARLAAGWSGDAWLVRRKAKSAEETEPFGLGWLMHQIVREKQLFRDVGIAALVMSTLTMVPPLVFMVVLDRVLVHQRMSTLTVLTVGILIVLLFDTLLGYLRRNMIAWAAAKVDARISLYVFDRLVALPIDFFDQASTGVIAHKLGEARRLRMFLTGPLFGGMLDAATLLVLIPAMFILSVPLTLFVLGVAVLMALVILAYMGPVRAAYRRVVDAEQRKSSLLVETIQGMRTIKSLALEDRKRAEWDSRVAEAVTATTEMQRVTNQPQTLLAPLEKLIYAGSLCIGAYLAIAEDAVIHAGTLVAFTMIATRATHPIVQIAGMLQQYQEMRGAIEEVSSIVNRLPEPRRANGVRPEMRGRIVFEDVRFSYPGQSLAALDGISFVIEPGTVVGIMGKSGSGKTTVTRLLQGLHQTYQGLIKIDGVDLREIELDHLRGRMGVVLQDSFLFRGTIRENILAGRPQASPAEMIEAARLAGAEEFIERLPRGYETMIEEHASNLSGGQRQRLAIARALIVDPPLLIFDEATSALDPDSEAIINANLRRIAAGRTVLMISHRLASLVDCDQILVLDRGKLSDSGRHMELVARSDIYRHLWSQQNRHLATGTANDRLKLGGVARG